MAAETPTTLQRRIATEFERNGWEYDLTVGSDIVAAIEPARPADAQALGQRVSTDFLTRNNTTRQAVTEAIERAIGGRSVDRRGEATTLIINDNRHSINMGPEAKIEGGTINVGGTQVVVSVNVEKSEVLAAVETLVRAGLNGEWNASAAHDLAAVIDQRGDVTVNEVRELTVRIGKAEKPTSQRVGDFLSEVAANALGGVLGGGISAGLGFLF